MRKNNRKGFTIVELVIVIAVIAILAGVLIPTFAGIVAKANKSTVEQETRAALTVILAEEDAQMSADADYYFLYVDKDEVTYFEYADGELAEISAVALDKLDANDTVWYADLKLVTDTEVEEDKKLIDAEEVAGIRTPLADLSDNVIVVKVVTSETTNAGFVAAKAAYTADITEFNKLTDTDKVSKKADDVIGEGDSAYKLKGSIDYVAATAEPAVAEHHSYTYVANGYTYVYNSNTTKWTITKN